MEDVDKKNYDQSLNFFTFRNEHMIVTVIIQMFLLFAGCVVVVGVLYVAILVVAIIIHHIFFDRDPYKVPAFVRNSYQFANTTMEDVMLADHASDTEVSSTDQEDAAPVRGPPTAQKKAQIMDKFVNDLDNTRKMKQQNMGP